MEPAYWRTPAAMETALRRVDDLPKELQGLVLGFVRYAFTNESLRAAVREYFKDRAACEGRHGKIGTWDVGRVTDMSELPPVDPTFAWAALKQPLELPGRALKLPMIRGTTS